MSAEQETKQAVEEVPPVPTSAPPADDPQEKPAEPETKPEEPKKEEEKKVEEPPADIREEPLKWLGQQIPPAVHKVNFLVLQWLQGVAIEDETKRAPLPGKNEAVTKSQFINFLKDGNLLANLANKLTPGSVEVVHEGEALKTKENQKANLDGFVNWAKTSLGLADDQVFASGDLEKGKAAYPAVFGTLWQLAANAKEKFDKDGIDVDNVLTLAGQAVKTNLIQTILNWFKRARPQTTQSAKQAAIEAEEKERAEKEEKVKEVEEEPAEKLEAPAPAPAPAVVEAN